MTWTKILIKASDEKIYRNKSQMCYVYYDSTLTDGTIFDSSRKKGQPFEFNEGFIQVIVEQG